jgi:hypothetical protein
LIKTEIMSKIIYLKCKMEVKIGDLIDLEGVNVRVTQELIDDNPELFEIKEDIPEYVKYLGEGPWTIFKINEIYKTDIDTLVGCRYRCLISPNSIAGQFIRPEEEIYFSHSSKEEFERQELLKEAKKRFPVGSRFKSVVSKKIKTVDRDTFRFALCSNGFTGIEFSSLGGWVYHNGQWATKLEPILTTEDNKKLYEGDEFWWISKTNFNVNDGILQDSNLRDVYYFSTEEAAEQWVKDNKSKTLEDYEEELLTYKTPLYVELKEKESKLYWLKILSLIAKDLNKGNKGEYFIIWDEVKFQPWEIWSYDKYLEPLFDTEENAQKAIDIMGEDKLNLIFSNE